MRNIRGNFLFDLLIVACAALLAIFYSHKGFAGYDLSPMISATNLVFMGVPQNYAISNPMPPGLILLTYLSCLVFGLNYQSFFYGNIVFILVLFFISYFILSLTKISKENPLAFLLFRVLLLSILLPTLITDGHFYISDTSNVFVSFLMYILLVVASDVFAEAGQCKKCYSYSLVLLFSLSPLCLFFRPNIGLVGFAFICAGLLLLEFRKSDSLGGFFKRIFLGLAIMVFTVFLCILIVSYIVNVDIKDYVITMRNLAQTRGTSSLFYNTVDTQLYALFPNPFELSALSSFVKKQQISHFLNYVLINSVVVSSTLLLWKVVGSYFSEYNKITQLVLVIINILVLSDYWYGYAASINLLVFSIVMLLVFAALSWRLYRQHTLNGDFFRILPVVVVFFVFAAFSLPSSIFISQNRDVLSSNFPLLAITFFSGLCYFIILDKSRKNNYFLIFFLPIVILLSNLYEGFDRVKIFMAGAPSVLRDYNSVVDDGFFNKLRTSFYHKILEEDIDHICAPNRQICASEKVMFGPRLEYLYARYHFLPPKGIPLWWHYSTAYQHADLDEIHSMLKSGNIKYLILGKYANGDIDRADMDDQSFKLMVSSGVFRLYEKTNLLDVYQFVQ